MIIKSKNMKPAYSIDSALDFIGDNRAQRVCSDVFSLERQKHLHEQAEVGFGQGNALLLWRM